MNSSKLSSFIACSVVTLVSGGNAFADDTELFFGTVASGATAQPNILLVLDTSGSMSTLLPAGTPPPYNPATSYSMPSNCTAGNIYYRPTGSNGSPSCNTPSINSTNFYCTPATTAFVSSGTYIGSTVGWRQGGNNNTYAWRASINGNNGNATPLYITCAQDGDNLYPLDGNSNSAAGQWGGTALNNYFTPSNNNNSNSYTFYTANYIAYLAGPGTAVAATRLDTVKNASKELVGSLAGVNVGVMRYDSAGNGGMVVAPIQDVTTGKTNINNAIDAMTASGNTPLSETLYEAYLYYKGDPIKYGITSTPTVSVAGSRTGGTLISTTYASPITNSCQKNYIVFLTDGLPNQDSNANTLIEGLNTTAGRTCYPSESNMWASLGYASTPSGANGGLCLKEMAKQLNTADISTLADPQNVTTYFIGFGDDVAGGAPQKYLEDAAAAGGGSAEIATDAAELAGAFDKTVGKVLDTNSTFTSPSIAVNAFNRTQVLEDLYVAMFKPSKDTHWSGNLKKFKLRNGMIVGRGSTLTSASNISAVGTNGFFTPAAKDFWQAISDPDLGTLQDITTKGGAANRIPNPYGTGARKVYTYTDTTTHPSNPVSLSGYPFAASNTAITDTMLGTATSGCSSVAGNPNPCRATLMNWVRGDRDADGDTSETDPLKQMGDPIHSQPAVVIYGNASSATTTLQKINDAVVFVATNDGFLHAIDVVSGTELWSFIPKEILSDLINIYEDDATTIKHYSLDGNIRVLKYDINNDGVVNGNDRVFLYVSQGRGGDHYYALDITNKNDPKLAWSLGSTGSSTDKTLGATNKSWSTPILGRINISGATQNSQKLVLIFGGGYDEGEDSQGYKATDSYGRAVYIVDAVKGTVLWRAGSSTDTTADLQLADMTHAVPSNVTVLDTNGDGFSDRMYVGDMAGQVWRFDITNGNPVGTLVKGGVIASLGEKGQATPAVGDIVNNRSFYNAPDVAKIVVTGGANYYNIAIGSGDRALPKSNVTTQDYFYGIRDYYLLPISDFSTYPVRKMSGTNGLTTVTGSAATTITSGWKLALSSTEKALAESITVSGDVLFTTFLPGASASTTSCEPTTGSARAYTINVQSGLKKFNNLYETFATTGLPSQISVVNEANLFKTIENEDTSSSSSSNSSISSSTPPTGTCLSGVSILSNCVDFGGKVKTFWQEAGAP